MPRNGLNKPTNLSSFVFLFAGIAMATSWMLMIRITIRAVTQRMLHWSSSPPIRTILATIPASYRIPLARVSLSSKLISMSNVSVSELLIPYVKSDLNEFL